MKQHEQQQIDKLILENGEYSPLQYLLQEGRLDYTDYDAWRDGQVPLLSASLFGNLEQIIEQWVNAEDYLQQLGWCSETIIYRPRHSDNNERLVFSDNSKWEFYFNKRFTKSAEQPQTDMFMDSPATTIFNKAIMAVTQIDKTTAREHLEKLFDIAPNHHRIADLERLIEALESLHCHVTNPEQELHALQIDITPIAKNLLRKNSRDLTIPLWQRLTRALAQNTYDSHNPELHASYTALQSQDWNTVRQCIEDEPNWKNSPVLITRHARACYRLHLVDKSLLSWFELCWKFPQECDAIEQYSHTELQQSWLRFQELEPELPEHAFPAWLLMVKPGLIKIIPSIHQHLHSIDGAFRIVCQLITIKDTPLLDRDNLSLRAQLKQISPGLFRHYISHNTCSRGTTQPTLNID